MNKLAAVTLLALSGTAHAQTPNPATDPAPASNWPNKTLRVVVPFTPGSATDAVARIVTERLGTQLGQTIVVENRPGAGGTIGVGVVAKANPDGYTLLVHSSSHTVTPTTYSNTPYDTLRDFSGITPLANLPNVLVIAPSKGIRSVKELIASAKAKPGSLTYASAGAGSATQLNAERFRLGAGLEGTHVPFKGTPEALTDIITGRIDIYFCPVISVLQFIKVQQLLGDADAALRLRCRFAILGLWRPTNEAPLLDAPLAVCDARSVGPHDMVRNELLYPSRRGETCIGLHNPAHHWFFFPHQRRDEVIVFKNFDSAAGESGIAGVVPHTAFDDPATPQDAPLRQSLELRAFVFYGD